MIHGALNILILPVLLFIVGLWKPKWILFWMDKPTRFAIIMIFSVMVMIGATLFGEGSRQKQIEEKKTLVKKIQSEQEAFINSEKQALDLPEMNKIEKKETEQ